MPERELKKKPAPQRRDEDDVVVEEPAATESGTKIKAELDELLDEIDDVLETNAEDFVKSYIQKGGE
ncbi:MAG: ubiquitin-like protein Pup [Actinomycetota bacterium]|nr:ubiquitin-like protein Pup [Actinomycetota bacterium]